MLKRSKLGSAMIGIIIAMQVNAQISYFGNAGGSAGNYVGWANTENFPLQIRHNANQPINFFTNNLQRMTILGGGNVGLGTTAPVSLLHLNSATAAAINSRFTNSITGSTATDGFQLGITNTGAAEIRQYVIL